MNYNKTYPKDFKKDKVIVERKKCFFIMPFSKSFDLMYGTLREALLENGYIAERVDSVAGCNSLMNKIMQGILTSQYIIVDISQLNPNVFYELGISHCYKESRNILILKDKETEAPTDIRYMHYIEYNKENLILLKEQILQTLKEIKYISELESALTLHKIISEKESDSIINILEGHFHRDEIMLLCNILNREYSMEKIQEVERLTEKYIKLIMELSTKQFDEKDKELVNFFFIKLLLSCSDFSFASAKVNELLYTTDIFEKSYESLKFRTKIALEFAKESKLIHVVMPWIIEYFSQSKSTHIDLNRYDIEAFLLSNVNEEINNAIINAIFSPDRHIREHLADIIGEKGLTQARGNVLIQLNKEGNIYTAASLMEALGKIGQFEDIPIIFKWIENHYDEITNPGGNFVFKHARNAIMSLDYTQNSEFLNRFLETYQKDFWK